MTKRIYFKIGDVEGSGVLYDDLAPRNIEVLSSYLPMNDPIRHARWSGQQVYIKIDSLARKCDRVENPISQVSRGQITFRPERGMFSVAYGRARLGDQPIHHRTVAGFGSLIGHLDDNADALLDAFAKTDSMGSLPIKVSLEKFHD
jgi:hypothetical protein